MTPEQIDGRACPIEETLKVFGGKWKASILYHLKDEPLRFNALRRAIPTVTQRMLTQQLRDLERDGLVLREHFAEIPARVEYSLTAEGHSLGPIFEGIDAWGKSQAKTIDKARRRYDRAREKDAPRGPTRVR